MRRYRLLLWLAIAGAAAAAAIWLPAPAPAPTPIKTATAEARSERADERWRALPARNALGNPAGELFFPHAWVNPVPTQAAAGGQAPAAPPRPALAYRVAGKLVLEDDEQIVLAKGDALFPVRRGDRLEDGYRVERIRGDHVLLLHLPRGVREKLDLPGFVIDQPLDE
jgi:hypothetical protein